MQLIFKIISAVITVYTILCFVRVFLTWIPGAAYSKFGRFLSAVCDPFLNLFRNISWLRIGYIDFSPAIALCILGAASSICTSLAGESHISFAGILVLLVNMIWSVVSSLLIFLIILLAIRLIVLLSSRNSGAPGSLWDQLDRTINPVIFRISQSFTGGRPLSYKSALIISIIALLLVQFGGTMLIRLLCNLLEHIPF